MARPRPPIARVRLARSHARLLAVPVLLLLGAGALAAAGLLLVGGVTGISMAAAAGALVVPALLAAAAALSVRVDVEESVVRVRSLFRRRVYLLTPGSLTRIHFRGERASSLRAGLNLGWVVGRGVLRGEEQIHLVRLAPTESAILIPTASGRLAIATSDEQHLIEALTRAARARARTEELAAAAPPEEVAEPVVAPPPTVPQIDPRLLTGIERALHEEGLPRSGTSAAAVPATPESAAAEPAQPAVTASAEAAVRPGRMFRAPWWARRRPSAQSIGLPALPSPSLPSVALPSVRRPQPSWLLPILPLAAAGVAWALGIYLDRMPAPGTDDARLTALALVLAGPATTIGAVMARTWWPRIVGVVVTGGVASAVFIGRALLPL